MIASVCAYYYRSAWLMSVLMRIYLMTCSPSIYMYFELCLLDQLARFIQIVYVILSLPMAVLLVAKALLYASGSRPLCS